MLSVFSRGLKDLKIVGRRVRFEVYRGTDCYNDDITDELYEGRLAAFELMFLWFREIYFLWRRLYFGDSASVMIFLSSTICSQIECKVVLNKLS